MTNLKRRIKIMVKDESWYVLKSNANLYYRETACKRYWVKDITKATQYIELDARVKKAEINRRYPRTIPVTLEKVEANV